MARLARDKVEELGLHAATQFRKKRHYKEDNSPFNH